MGKLKVTAMARRSGLVGRGSRKQGYHMEFGDGDGMGGGDGMGNRVGDGGRVLGDGDGVDMERSV